MCLVIHRLSLIEDNSAEREEAEIEDYESDSDRDSAYTLVKTTNHGTYCSDSFRMNNTHLYQV